MLQPELFYLAMCILVHRLEALRFCSGMDLPSFQLTRHLVVDISRLQCALRSLQLRQQQDDSTSLGGYLLLTEALALLASHQAVCHHTFIRCDSCLSRSRQAFTFIAFGGQALGGHILHLQAFAEHALSCQTL